MRPSKINNNDNNIKSQKLTKAQNSKLKKAKNKHKTKKKRTNLRRKINKKS